MPELLFGSILDAGITAQSFFICLAAALVLGVLVGGITVTGLEPASRQGDRVILDILKRCGGKYTVGESGVRFSRSFWASSRCSSSVRTGSKRR